MGWCRLRAGKDFSQRLRAEQVTIAARDLASCPALRSVGSMGRSLGKDTYRPPAQTGGDARVPGARSSFVLRRMRFARLLPVSLLLEIGRAHV